MLCRKIERKGVLGVLFPERVARGCGHEGGKGTSCRAVWRGRIPGGPDGPGQAGGEALR